VEAFTFMAATQRHSRSEVSFHYEGFSTPNGTIVPDDVFDVLAPNLTEAELRVLLYIVRRTFGFKKNSDSISLKQLTEGIKAKDGRILDYGAGIAKSAAARGIKGLIEKGIITATRNRSLEKGDEPTTYSLRFKDDPVFSKRTRGGSPKEHGGVLEKNTQQTVLQQTVLQQTVIDDDDVEKSRNQEAHDDDNNDVVTLLQNFGISQKQALRLANEYPQDRILEKFELVQWLVQTKSPLVAKNPQGFLIKAIEDGYLPKPPNGFKSRAVRKEEEEKQRAAREQERKLQEQFQRAREQARQRLLKEHPPEAIENTDLTTATAWTKALEALKEQVPPTTYAGWLKDTLLIGMEGNTAQVLVAHGFARDWLNRRLYGAIARTLEQVIGQPVEVEFVVSEARS
jgi:hypothetical protein